MVFHITKNLNLTPKQFERFLEFSSVNTHITESKNFILISRNFASMTFAAKEVMEFLKRKFPDGSYVYNVKIAFYQLNKCSELLTKLEKKIKNK
jgi:hypothetical protein